MRGNGGRTERVSDDKMSALRSALRRAPRKRVNATRAPLKAAVAQLLPDLLAFRAKGYTGAELAAVMREHDVVISARTLMKYIAELRPSSARNSKPTAIKPHPKPTIAAPPPQQVAPQAKIVAPVARFVAKPLVRRKASEVLGHRFDDDV